MFADFYLLPEQASTAAERHDRLFWAWVAISGFLSVLIAVLVIYFSIKYRRRWEAERPAPITGSLRLELFWTIIPLLIMVGMFAWGASVYFYIASPPADAQEIYVVGRQWMWKVQHPGGQREINELHVPVGESVKLTLTSEDVIHDFFVPAFRTKMDVLPGRYTHTWFKPTKVGRYHLFCAQYCGTDHSRMVGTVVVMERDEYQRWLRGALRDQAEGSMALEGRKLFLKLQCIACHSRETQRAPLLEGIYGQRVQLRDGATVEVNDTYLRESILKPRAKIVAGFEPIMPTYEGQLNEEEILRLIAFIKSLGPGQTPPRTEEAPPPAVNPAAPEEGKR